jgi:hypothetical protein
LDVDDHSFGVLMPLDGNDLPIIGIDQDTALLFFSLQEPGPAPDFVYQANAGEPDRILRRLIFDSILEVERHGRYISGPMALDAAGLECKPRGFPGLSMEAVRYGAALRNVDATTLSQKLYAYNTRPVTPALRRRLPDRAACLKYLGLGDGQRKDSVSDRLWSTGGDNSPWLTFLRNGAMRRWSEQGCKLYIGVAFEELPACLPNLIAALGQTEVQQFKIGTDLNGLLRPDKLVAYFCGKDALLAAANLLFPIVRDCRIHAVPFSAEIGTDGALSWGADPTSSWLGDRISWRQWICEKLAAALTALRMGGVETEESCHLALERLRLEGVDTDNFMPTSAWSGAA